MLFELRRCLYSSLFHLSFATYFSVKYALANTYLQSASILISSAPRNSLPSEQQLTLAKAMADNALAHLPNDPDILDFSGRVRYLTALSNSSDSQATALLQEAKQLHSDARMVRPYWPYSYVNLVFTKSALREIDADYLNYFNTAYLLGLDDRAVVRDLLYAGINDWNQITSELQDLTVTLAESALQQKIVSPRAFKPYLESRGQLLRLCAQMRQFEEKTALCNS